MTRSTAAFLALLAAISCPAAAQVPPAQEPEETDVSCLVDGYDVILVNPGTEPLVAGTPIAWSVRFARAQGVHALEKELAPAARHVLTGALGSSYLDGRTICLASIAEPADPAGAAGAP
jgi:hypothetical protein